MEYEKVHSAVEMGAEAIMDLSSYGDTRSFRRKLTSECPAMIGTVPIYDAVVYYHKALGKITSEEWIDIVRMHAEDGVDFMTIHCGMNRATAARFKQNKRLMNIVSRGGSIMFAWMEMTGKENPFYEHFDEILDICREYDITLSLGDACRPGCIADATDTAQIEELITLGELTKRAWEKGVPGAAEWDYKMSEARKRLDWEEMFKLSMDPEKARRYRAEAKPEKEDTCSMCGNFCAVKNTNRILDGEIVTIFDE